MEGIEQHEDGTKRNDATEYELILALFDINPLNEWIDARERIGEIIESILKLFKSFALPLQWLLSFHCNANLVVD